MLKIAPKFKMYVWQKLKLEKFQNLNKATTDKQVSSLIPKVGSTSIVIDNHMAVIQIQIGNNTTMDVLLDGGFRVNIITKQLRLRLGLPKPKLAPYKFEDGRSNNHKTSGFD